MGDDLFTEKESDPRINNLRKEISTTFRTSLPQLADLMLSTNSVEGKEKELTLTSNAQPAILTQSYFLWEAFLSQLRRTADKTWSNSSNTLQLQFDSMLGHSLGEYTALLASSNLSIKNIKTFEKCLKVVRKRGELMQQQVANDQFEMAALMPCDEETCVKIIQEVSSEEKLRNRVCDIANINSNQQIVISGHKDAVQRAIQVSKVKYGVKRAVPLNVSAPFHCSIMRPVAEQLYGDIDDFLKFISHEAQEFPVPIISNVSATTIHKPLDMIQLLQQQIYSPVKWYPSLLHALRKENQDGDTKTLLIEVGPKSTLLPLAKKMDTKGSKMFDATAYIGSIADIERTLNELAPKETA